MEPNLLKDNPYQLVILLVARPNLLVIFMIPQVYTMITEESQNMSIDLIKDYLFRLAPPTNARKIPLLMNTTCQLLLLKFMELKPTSRSFLKENLSQLVIPLVARPPLLTKDGMSHL
jgi:hypothetical protein